MPTQKTSRELLLAALNSHEPDEVERCVSTARLTSECVPVLAQLLEEDWHFRHEDIARSLQALKDPVAIEALFRTAQRKFPYLDYDDSTALARKCIWALADIGSPALEKLEILGKSADAEVAAYALERLEHWNDELHRKGH